MERYDLYKDSGVEWLESIPLEWNYKPFDKVLFESKNKYGSQDEHLDLLSLSGEKGIYSKKYEDENQERHKEELENYNIVRKGQIVLNPLVNPLKLDYFGFSVSNVEGVVSPVYMVFETQNNSKFLEWFFKSHLTIQYLLSNTKGVRPLSLQLSRDSLKGIKIFLPPLSEQQQIVSFLDAKTSLIDSLIEKTFRKIELLKEKRTSLINEVVTKGLNPDVEMKDSGVEWIGEIPSHWIISKVKYVTNLVIDGAHFTPNYTDHGVPFLRVTDIHSQTIDLERVKYISIDEHNQLSKRCQPEKGDLLLSKNGTIGLTRVIDWDWDFSIFVSLCLIKFKNTFKPELFSYFFQSSIVDVQLIENSKQSTVTNLHLEKIKELLLIQPPFTEQQQIISYLDENTSIIDSTISTEEKRIKLLKEYRQSLISEVVTGKVKVTRDE